MLIARRPLAAAYLLVGFIALAGIPRLALAAAPSSDGPLRLTAAPQRGSFATGTAQGNVVVVAIPDVGHDMLRLDYTLPPGTSAGVWAKGFPETFDAQHVDVIRLRARPVGGGTGTIAAALEIKGSQGVQRIPLDLHPGWNAATLPLQWAAIGQLSEFVVVVSQQGGAAAAGSVDLDIDFAPLAWFARWNTSIVARFFEVLLAAVTLGLIGLAMRKGTVLFSLGRTWQQSPAAPAKAQHLCPAPWNRDFVLGAGAVFVLALTLAVDHLGVQNPLESGGVAVLLAVAGAALAAWFQFGLTGRPLSPGETFQDVALTGVLAASSSGLAILQAPAAWPETLMLSATVAGTAVLLYHAVNALRLATVGRHVGLAAGMLIVGTPYVVGSLVMLEATPLLQTLGSLASLGLFLAHPVRAAFAGQVLVVFAFNVAVAQGLSLATKRSLLRSPRAHAWLLTLALATVAAPWIARFGSGEVVSHWRYPARVAIGLLTTMLSQAGLWGEAYLVTGLILGAIRGTAPGLASVFSHSVSGMRKAMVYSGTFMAIVYAIGLGTKIHGLVWLFTACPLLVAPALGALAFPLVKTLIETFDGSQAFFLRLRASYCNPVLYARGAVIGFGLGLGLVLALSDTSILRRSLFGFVVGAAGFAGIDLAVDFANSRARRARVRSWRLYLVEGVLGGLIGAAIGFYLDAAQVQIVVNKFHDYLAFGQTPHDFTVYPLLSKWGFINLGAVNGGVSLLLAEALAGVISWAVPAWLFAINRSFLAACFRRESAPLHDLFTREGFVNLVENMIQVLRWGLWMSPIINSFLRPMGEPTWYNQDGALRTVAAIVQDVTLSPQAFRAWSLQMFIWLLAYDAVRILIWIDHMGLRVATLVNLSFLGMDKLDERLARFLGRDATALCIPEAVKRFATWAPLLIPYYIPRGADWDTAWTRSQELQALAGPWPVAAFLGLPLARQMVLLVAAVAGSTLVFAALRWLHGRFARRPRPGWTLANGEYATTLFANGELQNGVPQRGYDVTRRAYDLLDPAGCALFVVDTSQPPDQTARAWPVIGNYPQQCGHLPQVTADASTLTAVHDAHGIRTTLEITLPGADDPVALWTVTLENSTSEIRPLRVVPYLEWVLNRPDADRGHTQYNRLFAEMEYVAGLHAVLAWDKHSKAMGLLAADTTPNGFLTSRIDFIGRARSLWWPRALESLAFTAPDDTDGHPTFDPIGSLAVHVSLGPRGKAQVRFLVGMVKDKKQAAQLIGRHLHLAGAATVSTQRRRKTLHRIGHGEIPPRTPQPYCEFTDQGRNFHVHTPFTPRPFDHTLSNALGHVTVVTNRGLHTTSSVNAQQNRITPDAPDIVTREVPGEAFYLYDPQTGQWFSPTYHPLNDATAGHEVDFGVDGTATFRTVYPGLATELTVFVPPDEPTGVYLLTVRNTGTSPRRLRLAPYFQIVLAAQPEQAGPLTVRHDAELGAVYFENPRNGFRTGPAFVSMSLPAEAVETRRGRFFGAGRGVTCPVLLEQGRPDRQADDDRPVAALVTTLEIPAQGEQSVVVVLGQADDRRQAEAIVRKFKDLPAARASLAATRTWWVRLMDTLQVEAPQPFLPEYLDWLKYQALAERLWARRGFYQASGAFGFRDQLQDSVNLLWMDPAIARRQILLHASQQFLEGDVVHWFHRLQDGRTGFAARTHASDNLLWLPWAVAEYLAATGDRAILAERTTYLTSELPFPPLPANKHGMGFVPYRAAREDTLYRHCMRAIDLVLNRRMGAHGLPLIGAGDWNDGLDEIGSQGRGESVWLGFFLHYILERLLEVIGQEDGPAQQRIYQQHLQRLRAALEATWREDRYLRAIHDDGTEIGLRGSGVWEIDALTAAWAVMSGINPHRGRMVFETALTVLERETTILLGSPPLREDTRPYLGRSSWYPEGVRENGMYCHGVQWLVGAARLLAEQCRRDGDLRRACHYEETAGRLWAKIAPAAHLSPHEIEIYGGQPNQQAADMVTTFDPGRMIWNGYTGAAGWMFRQAMEGVLGARLEAGKVVPPPRAASEEQPQRVAHIHRDLSRSPLQ